MIARKVIDELVSQSIKIFNSRNPDVQVVVDNEQVYDVCLDFSKNTAKDIPRLIRLSHDKDAGYFVDIDNVTLEFKDDEDSFTNESVKCFKALRDGKATIENIKLFGVIKLRSKLVFKDNKNNL